MIYAERDNGRIETSDSKYELLPALLKSTIKQLKNFRQPSYQGFLLMSNSQILY